MLRYNRKPKYEYDTDDDSPPTPPSLEKILDDKNRWGIERGEFEKLTWVITIKLTHSALDYKKIINVMENGGYLMRNVNIRNIGNYNINNDKMYEYSRDFIHYAINKIDKNTSTLLVEFLLSSGILSLGLNRI